MFRPFAVDVGSDWPVLNEVGDYESWLAACETLTAHLTAGEREAIFGGTAETFYGIGTRRRGA